MMVACAISSAVSAPVENRSAKPPGVSGSILSRLPLLLPDRLRFQLKLHFPVRNAGFHEFPADHGKTVPGIELHGLDLGIQPDNPETIPTGEIEQRVQYCAAYTPAAPVPDHRHAADASIRQQAPGADRRAVG